MAPKKLPIARLKQLQPPKTSQVIAHGNMPPPRTFPTPLPTVSTSAPPTESQLVDFLKTHLKLPMTSQSVLHFLKHKLHYHPIFTHLDFHIFQWATTVDSFRHDHHSYEWMVRTLAVSDRFDALQSLLLQGIPSNPCPCADGIFCCPRTEPIYRFALNSYCRVRRLDDALVVFYTMRKLIDGKPSVALYNILIHGFVKNGRHREALSLYDRLIKDRVEPDVFTFNILICSYCRNLSFELALGLFKEMKVRGCEPNVVSFNTLIKGFFRERKFEEGIGMAYEMIELGYGVSKVTCEILINGLCMGRKVLEACELLIELAQRGVVPRDFDGLVLVESACADGNVERAIKVVNELWKKGNAPSLLACTTLVEGLRRTGDIENAIRLVTRMINEKIIADSVTFNCLIRDACAAGRTTEADKLRVLASDKGLLPDGVTYSSLVAGYTREGKTEEGERLVNEMLDTGFIPDIVTYNRLINGLHPHHERIIGIIASNGGVVTAEELAPYLDVDTAGEPKGDDSYILRVLLQFNGEPEVDEQGNILYRYPSFQRTAVSQLGSKLKQATSMWNAVVAENVFKEKKWKFSKTGIAERGMVIDLGGLNLFGVIFLGALLRDMSGVTPKDFLKFVINVFPLLQVYAGSFFAIPLVSSLFILKTNYEIDKRNRARENFAQALQRPDASLKRKLQSARDMSKKTVIGQDKIIYSSGKDLLEQDYDAREWERKLREVKKSN